MTGSSDEEELRRVRAARGFQTRMEPAAVAGGATAGGREEGAHHEATATGGADAAAFRRAARRATVENGRSSSSREDRHASTQEGQRATARGATAAATEMFGAGSSGNTECSPAEFRDAARLSENTRRYRCLADVAAGCSVQAAAAMPHHRVQRRQLSFETWSHPPPAPCAAGDRSSDDEENYPGSRSLVCARLPFSGESELIRREADRGKCSNAASDPVDSSRSTGSSRCGEGELLRGVHEKDALFARKSMSEAAVSDDAEEEVTAVASETVTACRWRRSRRPPAAKSIDTDEEEETKEDDKQNVGNEGEEEEDFLFDQVPEDNATGPARLTEPEPREQRQGDEKQAEEEEKQQPKTEDRWCKTQQQSRLNELEHVKQEANQPGEKVQQLQQKEEIECTEEVSSGGDDEEVGEEDFETEERRRELGLPLAFGCGAGTDATQAIAAKSAHIRRFSRECSSSGDTVSREGDDLKFLKQENDTSSKAPADEEDGEALKWKSLGLPVSLEIDIAAHSPAQVSALAVNLKANRMATGGSDGFVRLWDFQGLHLENLRSYRSFCPAEKHRVEALAFSFKNDLLLVAAGDAVCRVYTAQAADLLHTTTRGDMYIRDAANTKGHTHTVLDCCWHPLQPQQFFSCGLDATVRLWDLNAKPYGILQTLPHISCFKTVSSFTCSTGRAAAGNALSSSRNSCTCCVAAPTSAHCLVVGCADGSLQLWGSLSSRRVFGRPDAVVRNAHSLLPLASASAAVEAFVSVPAAASPSAVTVSPPGHPGVDGDRGTTAELACRPGGIISWDAASRKRPEPAAAVAGLQSKTEKNVEQCCGVLTVKFFSDDRRLVSRGEDGSVALWDIRRFKQPVTRVQLPHSSNSSSGRAGLCLSPDEKYVCVTTEGGDFFCSERAVTSPARGAVHVLQSDGLSPIAALPIEAVNSSVNGASGASPRVAGAAATAGEVFTRSNSSSSSGTPPAHTTMQMKEKARGDCVGSNRGNNISGGGATAGRQIRQPLRVLWPEETNQLLVSCSDGNVCVLFDRQMSRKGVLLCVDAAKGSRRRHAAEQEAGIMYTQPYILVPGQLPEGFKETRDGQIIRVKPRGKERHRLFLEKQKTLVPPIPAKEGYAGTNVGGGNRSQHLLRQLGLLNPPTSQGEDQDDDPVAALRKYAKEVESSGRESQLINRAYAATQPQAVLEFDAEEEEAAIAAGVASGAVEESGRLLQQKIRCPRCALRMCQCGYMEEQNAAANTSSNKRQRI